MKKVLLTTTALAFAGSAFASDVSGYIAQGYQKSGSDKSLWTDSEIYVSGSKTASNGLTFGGTYTIGLYGASQSKGTRVNNHDVSTTEVSAGGATKAVINKIGNHDHTDGAQYSNVSGFVSGSFGKVTMGYHNSASRTHGATAVSVGAGPAGTGYSNTAFSTRVKAKDSITYSSPSFNGISAAYSMNPAKDSAKTLGVNYMGNVAGIGVGVAYGTYTPAKSSTITDPKADNAWNIKVSKGAFSGSYGKGTEKKENSTATEDVKATRMGVAYSAGKVSVGYSEIKRKSAGATKKNTTISAKYTIASGLSAYAMQAKAGDVKTTLVGTVISF